ncbi:Fosmidomycin resistance protein [Desulfurella amilsii]|uniref:Fosmidomycin resistance protein n=1 Tax=Desulfurella amilsii TaxID=1562698 RepID=A0A1X4XX73_9BACT|nr:MFS transporter [Desulfurella amilsii]OSS42133.1 Fosmidomycin resistance protein [Desulfurella amilsii]
MNWFALILLSIGHIITDINQSAVPACLPFFKKEFGLNYAQTGVILLVTNVFSSVIQVYFGYIGDKKNMRYLIVLGILLASLGVAFSGLAHNFYLLLVLVAISGLGVSAFHPMAFNEASNYTGANKATGMSIFSLGGNIGFAIGPPLMYFLIYKFDMKGTLGVLFVSLPIVILIQILLLNKKTKKTENKKINLPIEFSVDRISLLFLILYILFRTWIYFGLMSYLPFKYAMYLKDQPSFVSILLFCLLAGGALGTVFGGMLADRIGTKNTLLTTMIMTLILNIIFNNIKNEVALFVFAFLVGFVLISTFSVTVVLAQEFLPHKKALASGIAAGFAIGTGGIGVSLFGVVSDYFGLGAVFYIIEVLPVFAVICSMLIKKPKPLKIYG